jgi:glycosyltransferase involved in cell wall biosynthesis
MSALRLSCVVPAFNEADRIGRVLAAVARHPLVGELIVVDDGSTDATADVVAAIGGVRLVRLGRNSGKTAALRAGLMLARAPTVLLLDADLVGLRPADVAALARPVLDGSADAAISLRGNAPRLWRMIGLDYISGERVLPMDFLRPHLGSLVDLPPFAFEVWLNSLFIERRARLAVVPWPGVRSPLKSSKLGLLAGARADARMMRDIFRTVPPLRAAAQIHAMRGLRVPTGAPAPQPARTEQP